MILQVNWYLPSSFLNSSSISIMWVTPSPLVWYDHVVIGFGHLQQYFFFSQHVGYITPKINYFRYLKEIAWIKVSQKTFYFIEKKESLIVISRRWTCWLTQFLCALYRFSETNKHTSRTPRNACTPDKGMMAPHQDMISHWNKSSLDTNSYPTDADYSTSPMLSTVSRNRLRSTRHETCCSGKPGQYTILRSDVLPKWQELCPAGHSFCGRISSRTTVIFKTTKLMYRVSLKKRKRYAG